MISDKCNLCSNNIFSSYLNSDKMLRCDSCQVIFLAPEQIPHDLNNYYQNNVFYAENASKPDLVRGMVRAANFYLKIIAKQIKNPAGKLLVDVGSNYGILMEEAERVGFQTIGLEKNNILVKKGRRRGLNISTDNLTELKTLRPIDIITAMHVLEHLPDPRSFIKDAYKKLAIGGILVIGVPNVESHLARKDGLSWRYMAIEHLFYFSEKTLRSLLEAEGFEIIEIRKDGSNLEEQGIKKLIRYLVGQPILRDRFQVKSYEGRQPLLVSQTNWLKNIFKRLIILIIKVLQREDFILITSRKKD